MKDEESSLQTSWLTNATTRISRYLIRVLNFTYRYIEQYLRKKTILCGLRIDGQQKRTSNARRKLPLVGCDTYTVKL